MSQESLFDASVYVQRAYDALVLAYSEAELQEIAMLKAAVLRGYLDICRLRDGQLSLEDDTASSAPF